MTAEKHKKGRIEVICGSMFSGKSEELIRRIKRAKIAKKKVIVFKPTLDNRTSLAHVSSHDGNKFQAIAVDTPLHITQQTPIDTDIIGIDEAQFFSHELIDTDRKSVV